MKGVAGMSEMKMPLAGNNLTMMTGAWPYGPIETGDKFTVVKLRDGVASNDCKAPGWYRQTNRSATSRLDGSLARRLHAATTIPRLR
jgi:hypothetical protein